MPGNGTVAIRFCSDSEKAHIGQSNLSILGDECLDVALNESVYWQCVPMPVWNYRIGGHQVLKKWLSYRDVKVLGRPLTSEEVRQFTEMVRRLAAIVLMGPALDSNYETTREMLLCQAAAADNGSMGSSVSSETTSGVTSVL